MQFTVSGSQAVIVSDLHLCGDQCIRASLAPPQAAPALTCTSATGIAGLIASHRRTDCACCATLCSRSRQSFSSVPSVNFAAAYSSSVFSFLPLPVAITSCSLLEAAQSRDTPKSRQLMAGSKKCHRRAHSLLRLSFHCERLRACVRAVRSSAQTAGRAASAPALADALREGNTPC